MRIDLEGGKYTYVLNDDEPGSQYALRYGAPWRDLTGDKFVYCLAAKIEEQAERIKELEAELETERMRLAGCGVAALGYFDGCKDEYRSASLDDTLRLYAKYEKQSAALKLARDAFSAINIEAKTFMSYDNARNNFSDDTDERKAYERAMVKASELTKQALAAIDSLKGE